MNETMGVINLPVIYGELITAFENALFLEMNLKEKNIEK